MIDLSGLIGRTITAVEVSAESFHPDEADVVTLLLDDGTHARFEPGATWADDSWLNAATNDHRCTTDHCTLTAFHEGECVPHSAFRGERRIFQ